MKNDLTEVRASRLPMAFLCPASARPASLPLDETNDAARLGQAVHEVLRTLAETGVVVWTEVAGAAAKYSVPRDDVAVLSALASKLWPAIKDSFVDAITERELCAEVAPGFLLTGHADLIAVNGTVARIADWKTGRKDGDYSQQMRGYAALALLEDRELSEATATVIWIRDAEIENYTLTRDGLKDWIAELFAQVIAWDGTYRPGGHCLHCPRSHECDAANALVRRDVAAFLDRDLIDRTALDLSALTPAEIIDLYRKVDVVRYAADRVRAAMKAHVEAAGGVTADGVKLIVETQNRRELLSPKAWRVLEESGFTPLDFAACAELSISRVENLVARRAGRGNGAAAVRDLAGRLEAAGALGTYEAKLLKEKRA